jgi:hypothetical protein
MFFHIPYLRHGGGQGGIVQLRGSLLKFVETRENNGIFLLPDTGAEVKLTVVAENKPARIMAMLPVDLPQGDYTLEK